jgi:hypothetical protein
MIDNEDAFWYKAQIEMEKMLPYEDEDEKQKRKYNKEYSQEYYKQNKEIISARSRAYYQSHKDKIKETTYVYMKKKIVCECGTQMIYNSRYRHRQSNIHFKNLFKLLQNKDDRCANTSS